MSVVNNPEHYKVHEMECLLEMEAAFGREAVRNFALCSAWKYRYRAGHKDNVTQDLEKSDFYMALARYLAYTMDSPEPVIEQFLEERRFKN